MSIGLLTLLLFGILMIVFFSGFPIGFALAGIGVVFGLIIMGPTSINILLYATLSTMTSYIVVAALLFIFMGNILQRSGLADDLYGTVHMWMGPLRGGLAIATIAVCTVLSAMVGTIGAAISAVGLIAIPSMLNRKYNVNITLGTIAAGGSLGALIPPSIGMMLYALVGRQSVGKLFLAGIIPGLLLSTLYMAYILIICAIKKDIGPALSKDENVSLRDKIKALKSTFLPLMLILFALGTIFLGIATPTEAAGLGALGSVICAAIYRRLSWNVIKESLYYTARIYGIVTWILIGSEVFTHFYTAMGAGDFVQETIKNLGIGRWGILIIIQFILLLMGCFVEDYAIIMICAPIFVPIVESLGFNTLWFAILFLMNMQTAVITPPYGFALFYLKAVVREGTEMGLIHEEVTMGTLYRSILPFTFMQWIGIVIVNLIPILATWLPSVFIK